MMDRKQIVFDYLGRYALRYDYSEHPAAPTIELARLYWSEDGSKHCKNLFFRFFKDAAHNQIYTLSQHDALPISLNRRLRQGKLSFASEQRMERYLGLRPGSVSPFGLINDTENHVHLFLDRNLRQQHSLSFHPNDNTGTIVIPQAEFIRYLDGCGNSYEFIDLY